MLAVGFRCLRCGCEVSEWLGYSWHEGSVILRRLRCQACGYVWAEIS